MRWTVFSVLLSSFFSPLSLNEWWNKWELNFQPGNPFTFFQAYSVSILLQAIFVEERCSKSFFSLIFFPVSDLIYLLKNYLDAQSSWSVTSETGSFGVRQRAIFLTFILKYNETQGKVDPGVIILYNIPDDSSQKVILAVSKYQYQEQGTKSECWCWLLIPRAGDVGPAAKSCVLCAVKMFCQS